MSYCRWSSDNWKCDLYCYAHVDGSYTTHVAGNRIIGEPPEIDWDASPQVIADQHKAAHEFLQSCDRVDIDLPHVGETFKDATLEEFKARLLSLRAIGYHFPDHVLAEIDAEIFECSAGAA